MQVTVTVLDVKHVYGRERLLVRPVCGGTGTQWIEMSRVIRAHQDYIGTVDFLMRGIELLERRHGRLDRKLNV